MSYFLKRLAVSCAIFGGLILFLFSLLLLVLSSGKGLFFEVGWPQGIGVSAFLLVLITSSVVLSRYAVKRPR